MHVGQGVTAIWNDVRPGFTEEFRAWHMREHMAERVAIPGFRRARRGVALLGAPAFFTLYEADSLEVLRGQEYRNRLDGPTEWTRRVMAGLAGVSRGLAEVAASFGSGGLGGLMLTLRFAAAPAARDAIGSLLRDVAARERVAGAHLCVTDRTASGAETTEARLREDSGAPDWFVLVEATDAAALEGVLPEHALREAGVAGAILRATYRIEFVLGKEDLF
ncbi:hypothetical protein [Falsiroseomonas oryziterrae]|uniref:hypothetical protein n=1 Tax=Falsiroseomonas oryziterrae TaxID=2911368 RepID=UPI001F3AAEB1|nr:hypothetical protein [Roseomonas sp. NPKOSM-4]